MLPPVVLLLSPRTIHRTSPRTAGESFVGKSTAGETPRHVQLLGKNPCALIPGTLNATPHQSTTARGQHHNRSKSRGRTASSRPPSPQEPPQPNCVKNGM
ncbi:hypothetical protein TcCL_NonESM11109 [Trypanosoma cruzi]|nr:hypothetical protein TcCL_NonESM11109 [Trypanosoma cruzi]